MNHAILNYLQDKPCDYIEPDLKRQLDEIKDECIVLYWGKDRELIDGDKLKLSAAGIKVFNRLKNDRVGEHEVIVRGDMLSIGCQNFKIDFIRKLIRLQKDGVRTDNASYSVQVKNINILADASTANIVLTHSGFKYEEYEISRETVERWIK